MQKDKKKLLTKMIVSFLAVGSLYYCGALDRDCFAEVPEKSQTGNDNEGQVTFDIRGDYEHIYGLYLDNGEAINGHAIVSMYSSTLKDIYGAYIENNGSASANTVDISAWGTINIENTKDRILIAGAEVGNQNNNTVNNNIVNIENAKIKAYDNEALIYGGGYEIGKSEIDGQNITAEGNKVNITDSSIISENSNDVGYVDITGGKGTHAIGNTVEINGGEIKSSGVNYTSVNIYGGYGGKVANSVDDIKSGNATGNKVNITNGNINSDNIAQMYGGDAFSTKDNNVTVTGGQITANNVDIHGGSSNGGSTTGNKVVIENDELSSNDGITIMGGCDYTTGAGEMKGNNVTVNGGQITSKNGNVELYGGLSDNGESATSNSVDITNGNINADNGDVNICGGQAINTDGNSVAISGGSIAAEQTTSIIGGGLNKENTTSKNNNVDINNVDISSDYIQILGGMTEPKTGSAVGNNVNIAGDSNIIHDSDYTLITGGGAKDTNDNHVTIDGGQFNKIDSLDIYGGVDDTQGLGNSSAIGNSVEIKNKASINVDKYLNIVGGRSVKESSQNTVTISDSSIKNTTQNMTIMGAIVESSEADAEIANNVVTISGSNIEGSGNNMLLGAMVNSSEADAKIANNVVTISGSNIEDSGNNMLLGAMVSSSKAGTEVTDNIVNISDTNIANSTQINMIAGAIVSRGADTDVTGNTVTLKDVTIDNATIVGAINGNGAVGGNAVTEDGGNTVTIENGTISGSIYGGVGSSVKNSVVTIKGKTNLNGADILGSGSIDNNSGDISSTSNGDLDENNTLNLDAWTGKTVKSINNFNTINLNNIVLSDDGSAVLSVNSASDLTDTTININSFADDLDLAKDDSKLIVDGSNIKYDANKVGGDLITKDTVYNDNNGSNGVRVYGTALSTEDVTNDGNKDISLTVSKSILAGTYIDSEGKTHTNSESTEPGALNLTTGGSTNANIIAGSYASGANEAKDGKVVIDGKFTTNETNDIYAGYSENGAVTDNTMTLTANANVENTNLYGSNKDTDGTKNNSLNIDGFSGTVNSLHNFDNVNFGEIDFNKDDTEITSKEQSDLSKANLNVNFTTNGKICDKGETQQITLNNINIGSEGTKNNGDVVKEKTDGNGVEVNRLAVTTEKETNGSNTSTIIKAEVTDNILAGKYLNDTKDVGSGELTLDGNLTTTASTIAGSYSSSADKAAEGGKVTIDGAYTATNIYAGYCENNGEVKNNTIKLTANADVANTDLYGSNKDTDGTKNNSLNIDGFSGTVNSLHNFDNINIGEVGFEDGAVKITATKASNLENASLNATFTGTNNTIYDKGENKNVIVLNNISIGDSNITNKSDGDIIASTADNNGVEVNRLNLTTKQEQENGQTNTIVNAEVTEHILTGKYTNNMGTYGDEEGKLTISDGFTTTASTIAGSYSSSADKAAEGGDVIIDGAYTAANNDNKIYAGYSENGNGKVNGNTIELQSGADVARADLYGANDEAVKNGNASDNSLKVDDFSGKVNSLQNFNQIDLGTVKATNETFNKNLDNAVLDVQSKGDLTDTDIKIDDITVDEDLDLSTGTQKTLIGGNNVTTDETTSVSASDEATANKYVQTDNGVRIHAFNYGADNGEVTTTVKRSVLTSKYIDENNNAHGENIVHIDDDFQTNAETITGSYAAESNKATGGEVIIDGNYDGTIYAGYSENGDGEVSGNTVTVNSNVNAKDTDLWGRNTDTGKDNNLNVNGKEVVIGSVKYFDNINMNDIEWENNKTVLTIDNGKDSDLSNTNININNLNVQGGTTINVNDSMNLISGEDLNINSDKINIGEDFTAGVTAIGKGEIVADNNGLSYKIDEVAVNPQTSLIAENRAVATAFINQGSDLIASGLDSLHDQYGYGFKTFAAVYGNRSTYDAGSDLKINGWSEIIGLGSTKRINDGDLDWGVFYENGSGNYRTYNQFNDEFFRGDGSMVYNGGGVAARFTKDNGWYYEGSLRAGTLKSEISNALKDGMGNMYGYKSDTTYYGAHLGVGKILSLSDSQDLNVYGKYFHTYNDGDDFTIAGDRFSFDSVTSDRIMLGAKLTTNKNNIWQTHYGLAWEYEFNGDSDMTAGQFNLPTQSLQGSTFIGEIGFSYRDDKFSPWSFDLDFKGYQGQRDGFSGHAQVTYNF